MALCPPHILALGAGACGIELGIKLVFPHARIVGYLEVETFAAANLAAKIEKGLLDEAPIWSDAETFNGAAYRGLVDLVSIGLPCQPWSVAGKQQGVKDHRWLWPAVRDVLRAVRPRYLFMEEVRGFVQSGFPVVLRDLARDGWDAEWDLFSAEAVGAPHQRERFFLLADSHREGFDGEGVHLSGRGSRQAISDAGGAGEAVADASIEPEREQDDATRAESWKESRQSSSRGSGKLADARGRGRTQRDGHSHAGKPDPEGGGEELGDAGHSARGPEQGGECEMPTGISGQSGEGVADAACWRDKGQDINGRLFQRADNRGRELADSGGTELPQRQGLGQDHGQEREAPPGNSRTLAHPKRPALRQQSGRRRRASRPEETQPRVRQPFPPGPGDLEAWRRILLHAEELSPALRDVAGEVQRALRFLRPSREEIAALRELKHRAGPTVLPSSLRGILRELVEEVEFLREAYDEAQPAFRRISHILSRRVDRLRLVGNAVVPVVAAVALVTLAERLGVELMPEES